MRKFRSILFLLMLMSAQTWAQRDTAFVTASVENIRAQFYSIVKGESPLYTGTDYAEYAALNDENPFYLSDDWMMGDIFYNGFLYKNVPLQYDISSQKVITEHLTSARKIELIAEKIQYFTIDRHKFVRLAKNQTSSFSETPGFYDLLADGHVKLYARRIKNIHKEIVSEKLTAQFLEVNKYFYEKDNKFYPVKSKGSALNVFPDKKSFLSKELKKKKIKFSKERERALIAIAELYNNSGAQDE